MNRLSVYRIGLVCAVVAATAPVVFADSLAAATTVAGCQASSPQGDLQVTGTPSCTASYGGAYNSLTVTFQPFAALAGFADSGDGPASGGGLANLTYYFEVTGGDLNDPVPLLISTNLITSVSGGGDTYGFAEIIVSDAGSTTNEVVCTQSGSPCLGNPPNNFSGTLQLTALSGVVGEVYLEIEASAGTYASLGRGTASAYADPQITIDPNLAGAGNYEILFSDGVGNGSSSTPEPGTLLLIGCTAPLALYSIVSLKKRGYPNGS
jgi:hypothetical protein